MPLVDLEFTSSGSQAWVPQRGNEASGEKGKDFILKSNLRRSEEVPEEDSVITNTVINLNALTLIHSKH